MDFGRQQKPMIQIIEELVPDRTQNMEQKLYWQSSSSPQKSNLTNGSLVHSGMILCLWYLIYTHYSPSIRVPRILWKRNSLSFPWYFPEKVPKFNEKYFLNEVCYIHDSHYNQSVNEHNLDTWHKTHIHQTGENLSLLGHCHKFPEFSLIFWCFPQIPWVFPDWKIGNSFSRFSLISRVAGNPVHICDEASTDLHQSQKQTWPRRRWKLQSQRKTHPCKKNHSRKDSCMTYDRLMALYSSSVSSSSSRRRK